MLGARLREKGAYSLKLGAAALTYTRAVITSPQTYKFVKITFQSLIALRTAIIPDTWMEKIYNSAPDEPDSSTYQLIKHNEWFQTFANADVVRTMSIVCKSIDLGLAASPIFFGSTAFSFASLPTANFIITSVDFAVSFEFKWSSSNYEAVTLNPMMQKIDSAYHSMETEKCPTEDQTASIQYFLENRENIASDHLDKENYYAYALGIPVLAWKIFYAHQTALLKSEFFASGLEAATTSLAGATSTPEAVSKFLQKLQNSPAAAKPSLVESIGQFTSGMAATSVGIWKSIIAYNHVEPARRNNLEDQVRYILVKGENCTETIPENTFNYLDVLGRDWSANMPNEAILEDPTFTGGETIADIKAFFNSVRKDLSDDIKGDFLALMQRLDGLGNPHDTALGDSQSPTSNDATTATYTAGNGAYEQTNGHDTGEL